MFLAIIISIIAMGFFLYETKMIFSPLILFIIFLFLLMPFRKESEFVRRLLVLISILFSGWLLSDLGFALLPFGIAFLFAYLLDPFVAMLERKKIPRWASALTIDFVFMSIIALVGIFIFPIIFSQLNDALIKFSSFYSKISANLDENDINNLLTRLGINQSSIHSIIQTDIAPKIESLLSSIMEALLQLLTKFSGLASRMINIILVPILFFYFLKDFQNFKDLLKSILERRNRKILFDLKRIDIILRRYISWQIAAATIIATASSIIFSIFNVPYAIVLGLFCGLLNPIPYLGVLLSMCIGIITVVIVNPDNLVPCIFVILSTITVLHFINAYLLEPNIAGKLIGLNPIVLIASLFVFGGLFGFIGLLFAVPLTATLIMFFKDWQDRAASVGYNTYDDD